MPNDEKPDLKPCPCCGGEAWFDKVWSTTNELGERPFWSVRCRSCDLRTPSIANPTRPVEIWNSRTP